MLQILPVLWLSTADKQKKMPLAWFIIKIYFNYIITILFLLSIIDMQILFNQHTNNDQAGWMIIIIIIIIIIIMLPLFTILFDWFNDSHIDNHNKLTLTIWYHLFTIMVSYIGKHNLFVMVTVMTIIFIFIWSSISLYWITIFDYCTIGFKGTWIMMMGIYTMLTLVI